MSACPRAHVWVHQEFHIRGTGSSVVEVVLRLRQRFAGTYLPVGMDVVKVRLPTESADEAAAAAAKKKTQQQNKSKAVNTAATTNKSSSSSSVGKTADAIVAAAGLQAEMESKRVSILPAA